MAEYGTILVRAVANKDNGNPRLVVERADPTAGVGLSLLAEGGVFPLDDNGYLVIGDPPTQVVYRPVRFTERGQVIVCERVS